MLFQLLISSKFRCNKVDHPLFLEAICIFWEIVTTYLCWLWDKKYVTDWYYQGDLPMLLRWKTLLNTECLCSFAQEGNPFQIRFDLFLESVKVKKYMNAFLLLRHSLSPAHTSLSSSQWILSRYLNIIHILAPFWTALWERSA